MRVPGLPEAWCCTNFLFRVPFWHFPTFFLKSDKFSTNFFEIRHGVFVHLLFLSALKIEIRQLCKKKLIWSQISGRGDVRCQFFLKTDKKRLYYWRKKWKTDKKTCANSDLTPVAHGTKPNSMQCARDCTGSSNNLFPRGSKLSAIDVTVKAFFERLYLV